jgi:predicted ATPase
MKVSPTNRTPPHNLSVPLSSFIGREREIEEVKQFLRSHRLVTLTGPGGCGKTRLALKVAHEKLGEFEHGIWFVELASIFEPVLILQTVASTLSVREHSGGSLMDILVNHLSAREILLVLDNCEHLITACAEFAEAILQKCPHLKILATSREVLGIIGEVSGAVPPLLMPDQQPWKNPASGQQAVQYYEDFESVKLFVARAKTVYPAFRLTAENGAWVAEVCRRLDGMPLAIELAAARVRDLAVQQIAQRLDERFRFLTAGSRTAPPRQQTLRATLDWSYALLSEKEQKILQRLSVCVGSMTLETAEFLCTAAGVQTSEVGDALFHLVSKSLVIADKPEEGKARFLPRYRLLETIRQYALEKLAASGEMEKVKDRHVNYYLHWAEAAEPHLSGPDQLLWLELYEVELDNLRAALDWCTANKRRAQQGLRLVVACGRFWRLRGCLSEGRAHIAEALSRAKERKGTEAHALALFWGASLAYLQSDYPATRSLGEQSLAIWRALESPSKSKLADTLDC